MLYITFKKPKDFTSWIRFAPKYFAAWQDISIIEDPFVKKMILDVDKSEVISKNLIISPVFGPMAPEHLSGGVKALILMYAQDKPVWATGCGDNCSKWILEISKKKDLTIVLHHRMVFPDSINAKCLDTGDEIHSQLDFEKEWLLSEGYTKEDFDD